ncbi:ABC transporter ATP-binding protein [Mesorhizobium sp. SP-1A]|uniref:ABC transporter ATP-binding protein n=1 Tax=Mesorhizobium sp. SP-1A TaxID=3077840 RepID=UPI0028F6C51E|nr:ABC transporter ATP-binding protein [Mesorhizobium sp. SP-1A]
MQHVRTIDREDGPAALDVAGVSHFYGRKQALENVSFSVRPASFTVLLGLNGAGKTTLFSLTNHLYDTRHGTIRVFGHDINRESGEALRRMGVVFQARTLDLDLSVRQNLAYHARLHGIGGQEEARRTAAALEIVEMSDRVDDKARNLSGGQMRRVEIARALLHSPALMLLDEPTVGLDIRSRAGILKTIRGLVKSRGLAVLWATHLIDEVDDGDDAVVLRQGEVAARGRVRDIVEASGCGSIGEAFALLNRAETAETTS